MPLQTSHRANQKVSGATSVESQLKNGTFLSDTLGSRGVYRTNRRSTRISARSKNVAKPFFDPKPLHHPKAKLRARHSQKRAPPNSPSPAPDTSAQATAPPIPSPPPPPKRDMSEEKESRVEISFAKFEQVVLRSGLEGQSGLNNTALRGVARAITSSAEWAERVEAYREAVCEPDPRKPTDTEMRFIELLNSISCLANLFGSGVQSSHALVYGRPDQPEPPSLLATPEPSWPPNPMAPKATTPLSAASFVPDPSPRAMGVFQTSTEPQYTWANAMIALEVHDRYTGGIERIPDLSESKKRKAAASSSSESFWASKRRRCELTLSPSPRPSSIARHSNASREQSPDRSASESDTTGSSSHSSGAGTTPTRQAVPDDEDQPEESSGPSEHEEYQAPLSPRVDKYLAAVAAEMFKATGTRRHVLGIHASGMCVRFYMYDRAGVIYTHPLSLDYPRDVRAFISAVLSLSSLSPIQLGEDPLFGNMTRPSPSCSPQRLSPSDQHTVPTAVEHTIQVEGDEFVVEDLIMSTWSLYGRGTTVFGVHPATKPQNGTRGQQSPRRSSRRRPTGTRKPSTRRRANNYSGPPEDFHEHGAGFRATIPKGERLILKMSWQLPSRQSEDALLRLAQKNGVEGVIRLYRSCVVDRLSTGLRGKLVPKGMYVDRELRVQILGPRCIPLKRVGDLEDFKDGFRSLVRAHHELYEKAGILHRDISLDNLMVDAKDHKKGVLIDLDIAARVRDGDTILTPNLTYAGTLSFRAIDLLKTNTHFPSRTVYRDDLESFLYVLVYILTFYENGIRRPIHDNLRWRDAHGDIADLESVKWGYLNRRMKGVDLPHSPLSTTWVQPLCDMFANAYNVRGEAELSQIINNSVLWTDEDEDTMREMVTFERFMNIIA